MSTVRTADLAELEPCELGVSRPVRVDQACIDAFGHATGDVQWIHTDPDRAATGPFGATVAHGFLTLALTASMVEDVVPSTSGSMTINYGVDRVRFPAPVRSGSVIRGRVSCWVQSVIRAAFFPRCV